MVPLALPYGRQSIGPEDVSAVARALIKPFLTQGPTVRHFEEALAEKVGTSDAVAFSSGTAALHGAMTAAGLKPNDAVVTTPISFVATANSLRYVDADPIFLDVEYESGNLALEGLGLPGLAGAGRIPVVLPVSLAGLPVDLGPLRDARKAGLLVVEDASHALGAVRNGKPVGAEADMTVFSFHPVKILTTGEGGAVATNREDFAEELRAFRSHRMRREESRENPLRGGWHYEVDGLGYNYRLTDLQCALGLQQLKRLDKFVERRNEIAQLYRELLEEEQVLLPPKAPAKGKHAYHLFAVRFLEGPDRRRTAYEHLRSLGIASQVHYIPIPLHACYRDQGYSMEELPNAQHYYETTLSLPIFADMVTKDVQHVASAVKESLGLPPDAWRSMH